MPGVTFRRASDLRQSALCPNMVIAYEKNSHAHISQSAFMAPNSSDLEPARRSSISRAKTGSSMKAAELKCFFWGSNSFLSEACLWPRRPFLSLFLLLDPPFLLSVFLPCIVEAE